MIAPTSSPADYARWRQAAEAAARDAGTLLREIWHRPRQIRRKALRDFVTDADVAAQARITAALRRDFPDHGFLAEEEDPRLPATGPVIWIIDPVDGTTNYSRAVPSVAVSVAAAAPGGPVFAGAIYDPARDELFSAGLGQGATRDGEPLAASPEAPLIDALIAFDWSRLPADQAALLAFLGRVGPHIHSARAFGSAALALAYVAAGRLDGYFNFGCTPWDAAAGSLLIAEAGGRLTAPGGAPWTPESRGCLAGNLATHRALLELRPDSSADPGR